MTAPDARPNFLFILADQLRADFLGYNGFRAVATPHLDRLAARSVSYDQAISAMPICVPARAALLTGMSSLRTGVISNAHWLRPDRPALGISTWPQLLSDAGYQTAAVGKMHFTPWESGEGFQQRIIAEDKRWPLIEDDYADWLGARGFRKSAGLDHPDYQPRYGAIVNPLPVEATVDRFVTERALETIRAADKNRPFALMVGYPSPHCPYDPVQSYVDQVDATALPPIIDDSWEGEGKRRLYDRFLRGMRAAWHQLDYTEFPAEARTGVRAHYAALVKQIDDEVGTLMAGLEGAGLLDSTVIIFASDHGDFVGDRGLVGKKLFYEPSIRIPLLVRLPGTESGERCQDLVELHDITATILRLAGITPSAGMDSVPLPRLGLPGKVRSEVCGFLQGQSMVRSGPWKLTDYEQGVTELFNLEDDPLEQNNRIADPALRGIVDDLFGRMRREVYDGVLFANHDRVYDATNDLYLDPVFSRRGWQRPYPRPAP